MLSSNCPSRLLFYSLFSSLFSGYLPLLPRYQCLANRDLQVHFVQSLLMLRFFFASGERHPSPVANYTRERKCWPLMPSRRTHHMFFILLCVHGTCCWNLSYFSSSSSSGGVQDVCPTIDDLSFCICVTNCSISKRQDNCDC